jgi:hypothetical protein
VIATVQCRVVHGGGRSALATNRQTAAVGNSCQTLKSASNRPLIVRKNRKFKAKRQESVMATSVNPRKRQEADSRPAGILS